MDLGSKDEAVVVTGAGSNIGRAITPGFARTVERCGSVDVLVNNVGWDKSMFYTQTTPDQARGKRHGRI